MEIAKRGCGYPKAGCLYIEIPTSSHGIPLWKFLLDPTVPVPEGINVPAQGMVFAKRGDQLTTGGEPIYDIYDYIGEGYYPNVWDIIAEWGVLGFHQLLPKTAPIGLLSTETNYYAVHARAGIDDPRLYYDDIITFPELMPACPKHTGEHGPDVDHLRKETCPAILLNDITGGEITGEQFRETLRVMPSFEYLGAIEPEGVGEPMYIPSFFIKLPIGHMAHFVFYKDPRDPTHDDILDNLQRKTQNPIEAREI